MPGVCIILAKNVVNIYRTEGENEMNQDELRSRLIDGTIRVIAQEGLDKATTKQIGTTTGINEAYIYRCFFDKVDLFSKTFDRLDEELAAKTMQHINIMYMPELSFDMRCKFYFSAIWGFLVGNRDKCLAFMQYYYSPYFAKNSYENHKIRFQPLVGAISPAFRPEANVWMILNHIFDSMLSFAVKVHNGQMPRNDNYTEHIFRVIYASVRIYFKGYEERESAI